MIPYPDGYRRRDGSPPKGKGIPVEDTWNCSDTDRLDSIMIMSFSREKVGYPTQKPVALLKRIIQASSNPGDVVLDPFCGCGTTLEAAGGLGRRWVGIDISPTAARVIKSRLWQRRLWHDGAEIFGMPGTEDALRELKPFEFQNWVIDSVHGVHAPRKTADMGIDGYTFLEKLPIQVKQVERVGRPGIDSFQTAVRREEKHKGL